MLEKAITIATIAHQGQKDKAGQPYILHPLRVMFSTKCEVERICGVLHDVIEDTEVTMDDLRNEGFSEEVLSVLDAVTKRDGESYEDFICRILPNPVACRVKLADLSDNMDLSRIENPAEKDYQRIEKYRKAVERIFDALEEQGDYEYTDNKEIEISGCVIVPDSCTEDEFLDKFIEFVERNHWLFGGGVKTIDE